MRHKSTLRKILWLFLLFTGQLFSYSISGYVFNSNTGEAIPGVNIIVKGTLRGASTDLNGFFIIADLQPDNYILTFSHIAFKTREMEIPYKGTDLHIPRIELQPGVIQSPAVTVTARRSDIIEQETDISSFQIEPIVLTETPQFSRDLFKMLKFTPSITESDPYSPQLYVRGSDPGENMVLLDGMVIYNPQHFMASAAIFNPYSIKNIELLVGGFDAEFGGRNASILNITTREGHKKEVHGEFKPSSSGFVGAVEFPLSSKTTAMLSGRFISDLSTRIIMGSPNLMMDLNAALLTYKGNTRIRFSAFFARDFMDYNVDALIVFFPDTLLDNFDEGFRTITRNHAIGLQIRSLINPSFILETQLYHSGSAVFNRSYFSFQLPEDSSGLGTSILMDTYVKNWINDLTFKSNLTFYIPFRQTLKFGLELNQLSLSNTVGTLARTGKVNSNQISIQSFFLQNKINLNPLVIKAGYRFSRTGNSFSYRPEPRFSISLKIGEPLTIKFSTGVYNQYLTTIDTKNDEFIKYLDYYTTLKSREPISSRHYILGMEGYVTPTLKYSLAFYYKDLLRLYQFEYGYETSFSLDSLSLESGRGRAYGVEILFKGEIGAISGWVTCSYSRGFRSYPSIMNGKWHVYDGDQPYNLKALFLYKLTPIITASITFKYSSGFPRTWPKSALFRYNYQPLNNSLNIYPEYLTPVKNNVRYPPRLNLDLGWKKKLRSGFGYYLAEYLGAKDAILTVMFKNILFLHRDPIWYFYFPSYGYYGLDPEFLPSIQVSYSIKF